MPKTEEIDRSFLQVDLENLEAEIVKQPILTEEWGRKLAHAKLAVAEAKNELKLQEAELGMAIRANPTEYNMPKVTEDSVEKAIILQDEYQQALAVYNKAKLKEDLLQSIVYALMDRRFTIEGGIKLWAGEYNAEPRVPTEARDQVRTVIKDKVRTNTRKALND